MYGSELMCIELHNLLWKHVCLDMTWHLKLSLYIEINSVNNRLLCRNNTHCPRSLTMKEAHILVTVLAHCMNSLAHSDDNCQFQGDIYKLKNEGKCVSIEHGHSKQLQAQWEDCIEQLTKKLDAKCLGLGLKKVQRYFTFHSMFQGTSYILPLTYYYQSQGSNTPCHWWGRTRI